MDANRRTENHVARGLAGWVASLRFEDLSPLALERAKLFWYDTLGCAVGGSQTEDARILLEHHRQMSGDGSGSCTCFVSGFAASPVDAAFLNSHMVRAMDYNDIYWKADPCHPSDLICGPLALCEYLGRDGRDLVLATAIAYELQARFAEFGRPGIREYGWHHATLSGFAAPLAAGRVLGLTPDQLVHAMGISASRTLTLGAVTSGELTMMKNTVDPWASRAGVESALLAARGYTGPGHVIDGKEGLLDVFGHSTCAGARCAFDVDALLADLPTGPGHAYRIGACGMKSFPVEALIHSPLSAMMRLRREHRLPAADVARIRVEVIARAADILGDPAKYRPTTRETADHSLPYAMAVGLVDGAVTPAQFDDDRVADGRLAPVMDKVEVVANPDFEHRFPECQPCRVTLAMTDGTEHVAEVDYPKGDARDPMSATEIGAKFESLAGPVLGPERCDAIASFVLSMEHQASLDPLLEAMVR